MVMLQRWPVMGKACLCYIGGQISKREHGNVTEAVSFNGERMVMLRRWPV